MQNSNGETEETENAEHRPEDEKYLTFWIDKERFGIPISDVVQIISMQEITPLPDFPDYAKGIINLRGSIIPVIDMRIRLKKPEAEYNESTCIIVTNIRETYMGFIVDTVDEVADISSESITPAPHLSKDSVNRYLTGIGQIGDKVILLLDLSKILSDSEFEEVSQTAGEAREIPSAGDAAETSDSPKELE